MWFYPPSRQIPEEPVFFWIPDIRLADSGMTG
jgi:hypothetical protein